MRTYTTVSGDTWDIIAKKVYGSEMATDFLQKNNFKLLDILVFSAGTTLVVPAIPEKRTNIIPPWRR